MLEWWDQDYRASRADPAAEKPSKGRLTARLPALKAERPALARSHAQAYVATADRVEVAYRRKFDALKKGDRSVGWPRKKNRKYASVTTLPQSIRLSECRRYVSITSVPETGRTYRMRLAEPLRWLSGQVKTASLSEVAGEWYLSVTQQLEVAPPMSPPTGNDRVGIDLGIHSLGVTSDGETVVSPRALHNSLRRLRRMQRHADRQRTHAMRDVLASEGRAGEKITSQMQKPLWRKAKKSNRWKKSMQQIARMHDRISSIRKTALHQFSARLTARAEMIAVENLNTRGMMRNRRMARSIADMGWHELRRQLEYKAGYRQRQVVAIDRFFPSSKKCSQCGIVRDGKMRPNIRDWICAGCGAHHDRDRNAAINILVEAERMIAAGIKEPEKKAKKKTVRKKKEPEIVPFLPPAQRVQHDLFFKKIA
jgi:putative transposase